MVAQPHGTRFIPGCMKLPKKVSDWRTVIGPDAAGYGGSLLLHALLLVLLLLFASKTNVENPELRNVPVSLVAESEGPNPEPAQPRAAGPRDKTVQTLPPAKHMHHTPEGIAPNRKSEPTDPLEAKLEALSKLRMPNTDLRRTGNAGTAETAATGENTESGGTGPYNTHDVIRAQILRRWSLDMARLGGRNFVIRIHVIVRQDGTVLEADVVDQQRYKTDAVFRWIALSARNAVILSSPLTLPPGLSGNGLDIVLTLNPREAMQ